jgi:uncharacterized protein (DUF4415 family)
MCLSIRPEDKQFALFHYEKPRVERLENMSATKEKILTKAEAIAIAKAYAESLTDEEDAALTKAALEDPDTVLTYTLKKRRPGRPFGEVTKKPVSIRLSPDVLEYFRSSGPGWQSRIDEALREAAGLKKRA